jgi:putative copper export protein
VIHVLLPVFEWLDNLAVSRAINEAGWIFALIQAFHLVALAVFMGAILVVDVRLLGRGLTEQPVTRLARDAGPWVRWSLLGIVVTGVPQLMSLAENYYYSDYFWLKMYLLAAALVFTFTIRRKVTDADEARVGRFWSATVALVSIGLWSGVAISARLIGLF